MKSIRHTKTLFYYDGPQVFEARDGIGGNYVGVMVEPEGELDRFLIKGVSPERLRRFRSGLQDLRELLVGEGDEDWFLAVAPGGFAENFSLSPRSDSLEDSGFLPEPGLCCMEKMEEIEEVESIGHEVRMLYFLEHEPV